MYTSSMEKKTAYIIFGGRSAMANAMGVTPQAISSWPDPLTLPYQDRVIGAGLRTGNITTDDLPTLSRRTSPSPTE